MTDTRELASSRPPGPWVRRAVAALDVAGVVVLAGLLVLRVVPSSDASAADVGEMTEFVAEDAGIAISYPADWDVVDTSDDASTLLLATPNQRDSMLLRTAKLNTPIPAAEIDGARQFTMDLVSKDTDAEIVSGPNQVELAGLPGWYYLYRFQDSASGQTGVHAHYFLFNGDQMIVVVLQALPTDGFKALVPQFNAIAESLRVR